MGTKKQKHKKKFPFVSMNKAEKQKQK